MIFSDEEWRDIPGYEGEYQVSNLGNVRSLNRYVEQFNGYAVIQKFHHGRVLKKRKNVGYWTVCLRPPSLSDATKRRTTGVHRLVCLAFHGLPPGPEYHAAHIDGTWDNNAPDNLYWATPSENRLDAVRHGTHNEARKTHCINGHEYTPENTYMWRGKRKCKECKRQQSKAWYWRSERNRQARKDYMREYQRTRLAG